MSSERNVSELPMGGTKPRDEGAWPGYSRRDWFRLMGTGLPGAALLHLLGRESPAVGS